MSLQVTFAKLSPDVCEKGLSVLADADPLPSGLESKLKRRYKKFSEPGPNQLPW